ERNGDDHASSHMALQFQILKWIDAVHVSQVQEHWRDPIKEAKRLADHRVGQRRAPDCLKPRIKKERPGDPEQMKRHHVRQKRRKGRALASDRECRSRFSYGIHRVQNPLNHTYYSGPLRNDGVGSIIDGRKVISTRGRRPFRSSAEPTTAPPRAPSTLRRCGGGGAPASPPHQETRRR